MRHLAKVLSRFSRLRGFESPPLRQSSSSLAGWLLAKHALILIALVATLPSCVERKLTVVSVPAGADVFLDGHRVGQAPVTVPFTFYGTREVVLRKPGYHAERHMEVMTPPYFQEAPYDFYYETLTKDLYRDDRTLRYAMRPQSEADYSRERVAEAVDEVHELRAR